MTHQYDVIQISNTKRTYNLGDKALNIMLASV